MQVVLKMRMSVAAKNQLLSSFVYTHKITLKITQNPYNVNEKGAFMEDKEKVVTILYTNWRGEKGERAIVPKNIYFGSTRWHPEAQWLLHALDVEKQEHRDFAIKDIESWEPSNSMI
jgi:hypothetical protein